MPHFNTETAQDGPGVRRTSQNIFPQVWPILYGTSRWSSNHEPSYENYKVNNLQWPLMTYDYIMTNNYL